MAIREATEINVRDTDSMDRARVKPEDLTAAQSQLHRHGLFHIEPVPNTRMIPGEQRTRYVTPEAEEVNTLKRKAFVKLPNQ